MNRQLDGKKTLKSALLYSVSNIISIVVSLLTIPILTNLLSTDEMGIAVSFNTLRNLLSYVVLLSLYTSIDRAILDYKEKTKEYLSTIYISSFISTLIFYIIYLIFSSSLTNILGFDIKFMSLMFLIIMCQNAFLIMITYWNFKNEYIKNFLANFLNSPLAQILSITLAYLLTENKYIGRIIGVEFFSAFLGIFLGIKILKDTKFTFKTKYLKYALTISLPIIPHLLSQVILSQSDILMIKHYIGSSSVGIYSLALSVSTILYTILIQLMRPWSSWVYRRIDTKETETIKKQSKNILIIGFILTIGLLMINKEMIQIFLNSNYIDAIYVAPSLIVSAFFQFIYIFYYDINYYYKNTKKIMYSSLLVALLNIVLNMIFIPRFGYMIAGYTTLVSYALLIVFNYFTSKKHLEKPIYDNKLIIFLSICIIGYMAFELVFLNNLLLKYLLGIIIIGYALFNNRKSIIEILKSLFNK